MPNGDDKNWVRICLTVDGFRTRYGQWPSAVRLPPTYFENVVGHVLNPIGYALVSGTFNIVPDDDLSECPEIIAVGERGAKFRYGEKTKRNSELGTSTLVYFGDAVLRDDLGSGLEGVTIHDADGNLLWDGKAIKKGDAKDKASTAKTSSTATNGGKRSKSQNK